MYPRRKGIRIWIDYDYKRVFIREQYNLSRVFFSFFYIYICTRFEIASKRKIGRGLGTMPLAS